jgi:hypothetical protein
MKKEDWQKLKINSLLAMSKNEKKLIRFLKGKFGYFPPD